MVASEAACHGKREVSRVADMVSALLAAISATERAALCLLFAGVLQAQMSQSGHHDWPVS
jgi:hypothetical protein